MAMAYPLYSIPAPGDAPRRVVARGETEVLRLGEPGRGRRLVEIPIEGTGACFVYEAHPPRLRAVATGREDGPILRLARRPRERRVPELVLVQEYYTGSGAKRWPGFHVRYDEFVRVLAHAYTEKGSGAEEWRLVIAPAGWARNIARQFVNERDYPDQTISYRPRLRWTGIRLEVGAPGQVLVHLEADPALVEQGAAEMAAEGWLERLQGMFVHIFGDAAAVAAFVLRAPLTAFTVNAALVAVPKNQSQQGG